MILVIFRDFLKLVSCLSKAFELVASLDLGTCLQERMFYLPLEHPVP